MIHRSKGPSIGKDGKLRAGYRDIFLNVKVKKLDELLIHELSHDMCNHVRYREDDHGKDFEKAYTILKRHWPK
jgi:hypothetical protein